MSMKSNLLLLAGMAEIFASMDKKMVLDDKKREGLGGFIEKKEPRKPKVTKARKKNKAAGKARKKNRK